MAAPALGRVAVAFVERDVHGASAEVEAIANENRRNQTRATVLRAWARLDPDSLVEYVIDLDPGTRSRVLGPGAVQAFALVDPELALRAAEEIGGKSGAMVVRSAALLRVARDDQRTTLSHADGLPVGIERTGILSAIARRDGEIDPAEALAWAHAVGTPDALQDVLFGIS